MKRKIKFRGNCADTWRYGDHLTYHNGECIKAWMGSISPEYTVAPESVGQFTGVYDKNGKEIYEGDILKVYDEVNPDKDYPKVYVDYDPQKCGFALYKDGGKKTRWVFNRYAAEHCYEVIGNTFDNPELLKGSGEDELKNTQFNFTQIGNNNTQIFDIAGSYIDKR